MCHPTQSYPQLGTQRLLGSLVAGQGTQVFWPLAVDLAMSVFLPPLPVCFLPLSFLVNISWRNCHLSIRKHAQAARGAGAAGKPGTRERRRATLSEDPNPTFPTHPGFTLWNQSPTVLLPAPHSCPARAPLLPRPCHTLIRT